jgi:xanthine dehydrogenase molybdopterin-binding subunit B
MTKDNLIYSLIAGVPPSCRFRSMVQPRPAVVSIFADGSVMVTTAGAELGQGMYTKVKQARGHFICAPFMLG